MKESQYRVIRILKALCNSTRFELMNILDNCDEMSVVELSKKFNKNISTISRHLSVLKNLNFVSCHSKGKFAYYSLKDKTIMDIIYKLEEKYNRK